MAGWRRRIRAHKEERGQATLEFALVAVLLFLVLFGIIDFSRLFFAYATMANAVREGARYGIVHQGAENDAAIIAHARAMMLVVGGDAVITVERPGGDITDPSDPNYNPDHGEGCTLPYYCRITVRAQSTFNVWTPVIPSFPIVAQATMHFE
jgi:hypothetical protein